MEKIEYQKMDVLEKTYWRHRGKLFLVEQLIKSLFKNPKKLEIIDSGFDVKRRTYFVVTFFPIIAS